MGAITTTILAGTAAVTLNITDYWHHSLPGGSNEVTHAASAWVDLSKVCQGVLDIKNGETEKVTGLPFGSYTLAQTGNPPNDTVMITPNPAIVNADHMTGVDNRHRARTGETAGWVAGSSFTVRYVCTDANSTTGNLTLIDGQTGTVTGLSVGTTCTLPESAKLATPTAGSSMAPRSGRRPAR